MTDTPKKPRRSRKPVDPLVADAMAQPEQAPAPAPDVEPGSHALQVTPKLVPIFTSTARHIVLKGGRSSSKSWTVAQLIILRCMKQWERVLCVRETMSSIDASNYQLLVDTIKRLGVQDEFNILNNTITHKLTDAEIIFAGVRDGGDKIRSYEGVTVCWIEEGQQISKKSLQTLLPTIRAPGSQIVVTMNPDLQSDAVYAAFCKAPRDDVLLIHVDYLDNPFCSAAIIAEAEWCKQSSPDDYEHVWRGAIRTNAQACILAGKFEVESFDPIVVASMPGSKTLHGLDFTSGGASPQACIRSIMTNDGDLFITHESYVAGVAADEMGAVIKRDMPADIRYAKIWCDSAAPASIAMLVKDGYRAEAVSKWGGSVDDGIRWLRALRRIVIHPNAKRFAEECRLWSWKVDARSGEILNDPRAGNDHGIDAVRYSLMGAGYISKEITTSRATWERIGQYKFGPNLEREPVAETNAEEDIRRAESAMVIGEPAAPSEETEQQRVARLEKERQDSNQRRLGVLFGLPGAGQEKAHPGSRVGAPLGANPGPRPGDRPSSEDDGTVTGVWFVDAHGNRYRRNAPAAAPAPVAVITRQDPMAAIVAEVLRVAALESFSVETDGNRLRVRPMNDAALSRGLSPTLAAMIKAHGPRVATHLNR